MFAGPKLDADLTIVVRAGDAQAILKVSADLRRVSTSWNPGGADVGAQSAASVDRQALGLLDQRRRALRAHLCSVRERFERLMVVGRSWTVGEWSRMFADPLRAAMARRLVWEVHAEDGVHLVLPEADGLRDVAGDRVSVRACYTIELWHPARAPEQQALWRERLVELGVVQPIAQVDREVFLADPGSPTLAVAEAAHVDQTQLRGFLRARGWRMPYLGPWFHVPEATRLLTPHGPLAVLEMRWRRTV